MATATLEAAPAVRRKRFVTPMKTVQFVLLVLFASAVLIPLYVVLVTSFKGGADVSPANAWDLPYIFSTDGWASAITRLAPALGRSLILAVSAAVLSSILGSLNGYVFAKWKFPGADDVTLSGAVAKLHEAGKCNRFAADTATEVAKAIPALIEQAPTLTRPPTNVGGGSPGARQTPAAPVRKSLVG